MADPKFDWTVLLPEDERKKVVEQRAANLERFLAGFPVKKLELSDQAQQIIVADGRAALQRAEAQVAANRLDPNACKVEGAIWQVIDLIAATLAQPIDPRTWDHLLIYVPKEHLIQRLADLANRSADDGR